MTATRDPATGIVTGRIPAAGSARAVSASAAGTVGRQTLAEYQRVVGDLTTDGAIERGDPFIWLGRLGGALELLFDEIDRQVQS